MVHNITFKNKSDFIKRNPDSAFTKVVNTGFELWCQFKEPDEYEREISIRTTLSSEHVGDVNFIETDTDIMGQHINIKPEFQRRGLATAMVVLVVKICRKPLGDLWSASEMSKDGRLFWEHPHHKRPVLFKAPGDFRGNFRDVGTSGMYIKL